MDLQNQAFRRSANRRHWFGFNVLTVCILLTLFFLATVSLPQIAKPVRADFSKEHRTEQPLVALPSRGKYVRQGVFKESAQFVVAPRIIASARRPAPRGGPPAACNEGEFECKGTLCYHQCLVCPSGWAVTPVGQCC